MTKYTTTAEKLEEYHILKGRAGQRLASAAAWLGEGKGYASEPNPKELAEAVAILLAHMLRWEGTENNPSVLFGNELSKLDPKVWPWAKAPATPDEARVLYKRLLDDEDAHYDHDLYAGPEESYDDPSHGNSYDE